MSCTCVTVTSHSTRLDIKPVLPSNRVESQRFTTSRYACSYVLAKDGLCYEIGVSLTFCLSVDMQVYDGMPALAKPKNVKPVNLPSIRPSEPQPQPKAAALGLPSIRPIKAMAGPRSDDAEHVRPWPLCAGSKVAPEPEPTSTTVETSQTLPLPPTVQASPLQPPRPKIGPLPSMTVTRKAAGPSNSGNSS